MNLIIKFTAFLVNVTRRLHWTAVSLSTFRQRQEERRQILSSAMDTINDSSLYSEYLDGEHFLFRDGNTVTVYDHRGYTVDVVDDPEG